MKPFRQKKNDRLITPGASSAEIAADFAAAPFDKAMRDAERTCTVDGCNNPLYIRGCCNAHYLRLRRHGSPTAGGTSKRLPVSWLRELVASPPDECVAWPFGGNGNGYGWAWYESRRIGAHRLSLVLATGENPKGLVAAHKCHNRQCVNPRHLSWETQKTNAHQTRDGGNGRSKLTHDQVRQVKASDASSSKLAKAFGVSVSTIQKIRSGEVWGGV